MAFPSRYGSEPTSDSSLALKPVNSDGGFDAAAGLDLLSE